MRRAINFTPRPSRTAPSEPGKYPDARHGRFGTFDYICSPFAADGYPRESPAENKNIKNRSENENSSGRKRVCRTRLGRLFFGNGRRGGLHRHGRLENRTAQERANSDLRARTRRDRAEEHAVGTAEFRDRSGLLHGRHRDRIHRRRNPSGRERRRRPALRVRSGAYVRLGSQGICSAGHQEHRSGRHVAPDSAGRAAGARPPGSRSRIRCGFQSRVSERRQRHQRLHEPRPRSGRSRERARERADESAVPPLPAEQFPGNLHGRHLGRA